MVALHPHETDSYARLTIFGSARKEGKSHEETRCHPGKLSAAYCAESVAARHLK